MQMIWKRGPFGPALALVAVAAVLLVSLMGCAGRTDMEAGADEPTYVEATVGDIEDVVTATGNVTPEREVALVFDVAGTVVEVAVERGDAAHAGQVLARLDDDDLQDAVEQAEQSLRTAQANLERVRTPPTEAEIAAAEAAVASARANLNRLYEEPTESERRQAQLEVDSAKNQLWSQQATRDAVCGREGRGATEADCDSAEAAVLNAEVGVQQAELKQQMMDEPPKASDVAQAQSQVDQAQANLRNLLEQPRPKDIAVQEAQVEEAELNLVQTKETLADATLVAPFDGTVAAVNVEEGERVSGSAPAVVFVDDGQLWVHAPVDEMDVARVREGQDVHLSFTSLGDETVDGRVTDVAVVGTETAGGMAYEVKIVLSETTAPVKLGMTVDVEIVVERAEDAVLVPNQAITEDREQGVYFVNKRTPTEPQRVEVELGLRSDTYSQVVSGIEEGDQVQLIVPTQNGDEDRPGGRRPFGGPPGGGR
ncbi:MAG: efflux RND transporter periplasmic adaptor subunit [Anaerolineales bacterium]